MMKIEEAMICRQTEEFIRIQSEIYSRSKEMLDLFDELDSKYPLDKEYCWRLLSSGSVLPTYTYKDEENED